MSVSMIAMAVRPAVCRSGAVVTIVVSLYLD
jgi:hypothetical protein